MERQHFYVQLKFFCSVPLVNEQQSMSNDKVAGGKWVFMCLKVGIKHIFPVYQDLLKKVLKFVPDRRE